MKKFFQYMLAATLTGGVISLTACSNDDENVTNEWNMTYVSLQQADYLKPIPSFSLRHILNEKIEGEVKISVVAAIQKPATHDIKVYFNIDCNGISNEKIIREADFVIIKAGSTKSAPIDISITDWSDIENIQEATEYTLNIKTDHIETSATEVVKSNFYQSISVKINKGEAKADNLIFGQAPENSELHTNAKDWDFTFMPGVENANSNSVAGTGGNDVATNGIPFWISVNLKSPQTITGIKTFHWGGGYAPTKIELYVSNDGSKWEPMGEVNTQGTPQEISFKKPKVAQYIKYQMINVPSRVDMTYFNIYMQK